MGQKAPQYAAEKMSDGDGKAEVWEGDMNNDDDYSCLSKEEFVSRISIRFIHINKDGAIAFYYNTDGMFTDHNLEIRANVSGEILSADL